MTQYPTPRGISVTDPIGQAFDRAIGMTFKPFNIGKWFVLGFIVWLSILGDGSSSFNFNFPGGGGGRRVAPAPVPFPPGGGTVPGIPPLTTAPAANEFQEVTNWVNQNLSLAVTIAAVAIVLIAAITLLILWISSRAKFILLRAVATDTYEVAAPWKEFRALGNSLFGFRAALMLASWGFMIVVAAIALWIAWPDIQSQRFDRSAMTALLMGFLLIVPTLLILGLVSWCTEAFVTPIMYARGIRVGEAWGEFRGRVLRGHIGSIILFLLMSIVLGIGVVICQIVVGCGTCCVGFLPYIGTVFLLPALLVMRCYSIYFVQQFHPDFVFIQDFAPPSGGFPVIGLEYPPIPPGSTNLPNN